MNSIFIKDLDRQYKNVNRYVPPTTGVKHDRLHLNENLHGPSPQCLLAIKNLSIKDLYLYDLEENDFLIDKINQRYGFPNENILIHNGSSEVIKLIFNCVLNKGDSILLPNPSWSYYKNLSNVANTSYDMYAIEESDESYIYNVNNINDLALKNHPKMIVITSPNMPTGNVITNKGLEEVLNHNSESMVMVDQAYWGYDSKELDVNYFIDKFPNVVFVRTFSKFFGLANERIGFCVCGSKIKEYLELYLPLFKVSYTSRLMATAALEDKEYYDNIHKVNSALRDNFINSLNLIEGVKAFESEANYVYVKFDECNPSIIRSHFEEKGILVRLFDESKDVYMRITIGTKRMMEDAISILNEYFNSRIITKKYVQENIERVESEHIS